MEYFGEFVALSVVFSWSASALLFEQAGRRIGSVTVNFYKLLVALIVIGIGLFFITGSFFPIGATPDTWFWMLLSGIVGFSICDLALFYAFVVIGSRFSQLIMTAYPLFAAITAWMLLGENMPLMGYVGMPITILGVAMSIFKSDSNGSKFKLNLPTKGVVCALIGAVGQGVGFVLSKKGMAEYEQVAGLTDSVRDLIPVAATQIRCISGFFGFFLIMLFSKRLHLVPEALNDKRGFTLTMYGTIFGPLLGVCLSLIALQHSNTGVVTTIMATTPIALLLYDMLVRKKKVTPREIIGTLLAVFGVSLFFM